MTEQQQPTWQDFEDAMRQQNVAQSAPQPTEFEYIVTKLADAEADPAWYNIAAIVDRLRREHVALVTDLRETNENLQRMQHEVAWREGAIDTAVQSLEAINDGGMIHSEIKSVAYNALGIIADARNTPQP